MSPPEDCTSGHSTASWYARPRPARCWAKMCGAAGESYSATCSCVSISSTHAAERERSESSTPIDGSAPIT